MLRSNYKFNSTFTDEYGEYVKYKKANRRIADNEKELHVQYSLAKIEYWDKVCKKIKNKALAKFLNLAQFIRLSLFDIEIAFSFFSAKQTNYEKKFYYRINAMLLYEFIQDTKHMLGKEISESVGFLTNNDAELIKELNALAKEISKIDKHEYLQVVKNIRITAIAHKEQNAKVLFRTIKSTKIKEVLILSIDIFLWRNQFESYFVKVLNKLWDKRRTPNKSIAKSGA